MQRRTFLAAPILAAAAASAATDAPTLPVQANGDGIHHTPAEYSALLQKLSAGIEADSYSRGGVVAKLEQSVAAALGKETAVWLSTGTLANHLAVRLLAGEKRRVVVQHECHLFNDCGDCCQTLSGLNLIPLARDQATFTVDDLEREAERSASGRVSVPIGAIQIETPVRRKTGETFDLGGNEARFRDGRGIARSVFTSMAPGSISPPPIAAFRCAITRRSSIPSTFPCTSISTPPAEPSWQVPGACSRICIIRAACSATDSARCGHSPRWRCISSRAFPERYAKAVAISEQVITSLQADSRFEVTRVPNGTNIFFCG